MSAQLSLAPKPLPLQSGGDSPSVPPPCRHLAPPRRVALPPPPNAVAAWSSVPQRGGGGGRVPPCGYPAGACWEHQPLEEKFPTPQRPPLALPLLENVLHRLCMSAVQRAPCLPGRTHRPSRVCTTAYSHSEGRDHLTAPRTPHPGSPAEGATAGGRVGSMAGTGSSSEGARVFT